MNVKRTATRIHPAPPEGAQPESFDIDRLRDIDAFILLGDPGSGKTTAFKDESDASNTEYITARDFIALAARPEWHSKTLFIDGLDETRAGTADGRGPLDAIRRKIDEIRPPRFRISCRHADWLGESDKASLERVAPKGRLDVFRLDPPTAADTKEILAGAGRTNPTAFIESAREHGLESLLENPQTLKMLSQAVHSEEWPETREEVFKLACESLAAEPNTEHSAASRHTAAPLPRLLDAAGFLCALHLIADVPGFSFGTIQADNLDLNSVDWKDLPVQQVVCTRLFTADDGPVFRPLHRTIAEYLGSRFIGSLINEGASVGRVLALITGVDGGIVSPLRGLHAWLPFHDPQHREMLNRRDPVGILLYGEPANFSPLEKKCLLAALHDDIRRAGGYLERWPDNLLGRLLAGDSTHLFESIFSTAARLPEDQIITNYALEVITSKHPHPELAANLDRIVRDASYWPSVRRSALHAFINVCPLNKNPLLQLAQDINNRVVEDRGDDLLGELLSTLFPDTIGPTDVFAYLHTPQEDQYIGVYRQFWSWELAKRIRPAHLPVLLDSLATKPNIWSENESGPNFMMRRFVGRLLVKMTETDIDQFPIPRIYEWLGIPLDQYRHSHLDHSDAASIRQWIESKPTLHVDLISIAIDRCRAAGENYPWQFQKESSRLCAATPGFNIAPFWLDLAAKESDREFARFLFGEARRFWFKQPHYPELSVESFQSWISDLSDSERRRVLHRDFDGAMVDEIPEWHSSREDRKDESTNQKEEWIAVFRQNRVALRQGLGPQNDFYVLGGIYDGTFFESKGQSPGERLKNFFEGDEALIGTALAAIRNCIDRQDLPSSAEIVKAAKLNKTYSIGAAVLAGVELLFENERIKFEALRNQMLERILAFRFSNGVGQAPNWLRYVIENHSELFCKVYSEYTSQMLKSGRQYVPHLYQLAHEAAYGPIAKGVLPELLNAFPSPLRKGQAEHLTYALEAALQFADPSQLRKTVEKRLRRRSLDVAQRVYLLATGFLLDPVTYHNRVVKYVGSRHERQAHLEAFLTGKIDKAHVSPLPSVLETVIQLLAPGSSPNLPVGGGMVTPVMRRTDFVGSIINRLAATPGADAAHALARLASRSDIQPWHNKLTHAAYVQQKTTREAEYRHPSTSQVIETLQGGQPANAADLAALTTEILEVLANETRYDNADIYKQYWNPGRPGKPESSKPENDCRDVLLSQLKPRLKRFGIDAQPEGQYLDDKRADLRVACNRSQLSINVPIEVKKSSHRDLWRAPKKQLAARYTVDPGASGHGIYLVFWFGPESTTRPATGRKPTTPDELRRSLMDELDDEQRRLLSVVVFDCSAHRS